MKLELRKVGFIKIPNLIPNDLVDELIYHFKSSLSSETSPRIRQPRFAKVQGDDNYPRGYYSHSNTNEHGFMIEGLKDPHADSNHPILSSYILRVLCGPEVESTLNSIFPDEARFQLVQSMLFDANPGTEPHIDSYYIDTEPRGNAVGFWLALEDINPDAGAFFLMRESNHHDYSKMLSLGNDDFLNEIVKIKIDDEQNIVTPEMRKGDALFWDINTIHGSHDVKNPRKSRKSLTGHFAPINASIRNRNRILQTAEKRKCMNFIYSASNRPSLDEYLLTSIETHPINLDGVNYNILVSKNISGEQKISIEKK